VANKLRETKLGPFTGITFEFRRVKLSDYMQVMKDLPFSFAPGTVAELDKLKDSIEKMSPAEQSDANARSLVLFLQKGVTRMKYPDEDWSAPNIWYGDESQCPADQVIIADLGTDADLVAAEIAQFSFNLRGIKALEGFFRQQGEPDPRPDGEAVRTEAVEPAV
jgi:hypothetical protein